MVTMVLRFLLEKVSFTLVKIPPRRQLYVLSAVEHSTTCLENLQALLQDKKEQYIQGVQ